MIQAKEIQKWWQKPLAGFRLAFVCLVITAALGTLLRYLFIEAPAWANYKHLLHAHSHIAFLGWVYNALYILIVHYFIPRKKQHRLMKLFWLTQTATLGMLIFFPLQGYARDSIIFTTLHLFFSWGFAILSWRQMQSESTHARKYLRLALLFMIISSLGPLALGPMMVNGMGGSNWYHSAIYYYLHFQYNGWFIFALLALLYQHLQQQGLRVQHGAAGKALKLFGWGCVLTLGLSIVWAAAQTALYLLAALGGVLQLVGCYYLYLSLRPVYGDHWRSFQPLVKQLLLFAALAFLTRNVLQLMAAFPLMAQLAFGVRNFVIAFLHLVFLGIVTPLLLAAGFHQRWLPLTRFTRASTYLALLAFVCSQLLLLLLYAPGLAAFLGPHYSWGMFVCSAFMLLAFWGIALAMLDRRKQSTAQAQKQQVLS